MKVFLLECARATAEIGPFGLFFSQQSNHARAAHGATRLNIPSLFFFFYFFLFFLPGGLTCVPELLVPIDGEDDQQVPQDVHHDGEDEKAAQSCGDPRRVAQRSGAVQVRPIYDHCNGQLQNFPPYWAKLKSPVAASYGVDTAALTLQPPTGFMFIFCSPSPPVKLHPAAEDQLWYGAPFSLPLCAALLGVTSAPLCHSLCRYACVPWSRHFKPSQHVIKQSEGERFHSEGETLSLGGCAVEKQLVSYFPTSICAGLHSCLCGFRLAFSLSQSHSLVFKESFMLELFQEKEKTYILTEDRKL